MNEKYYVYLITNKYRGTIYTGLTSNLENRIKSHREGLIKGFAYKYNLNKLVYFETLDTNDEAINRERHIKHWRRQWKIDLIEKVNPKWEDLSEEWRDPRESEDGR